jgi:threonine/homoserine efflux transporter RhtA
MVLMTDPNLPQPVDEERRKRQRRNAVALGVVLGVLALLFYVLTIAKMGPALFTSRDL